MKRLTIHLKKVEKINNKIHNTMAFIVKNDEDIAHHLSMYNDNIKKHYFTNLN